MNSTALLDDKGRVNRSVDYEIKEDGSGINLKSFEIAGKKHSCELVKYKGVVQYKPVNWGEVNPGAGQAGVYQVRSEGSEGIAIILDYRAAEGDWRISIELMTQSEQALQNTLMMSSDYLVYVNAFFEYVNRF